jgi:apolipoprotein N-acyltransferase
VTRALPVLATAASAIAYGWAFPTTSLRALAWVALVPFLVALRRASGRGAVALAVGWSVLAAWTLNAWFPQAVSVYYEQPWWVGFGFFLGVSLLTAAPHYALFALCYRRLPAGRMWTPLAVAAAWVATELTRTHLLGGDPWALAGYSQAAHPVVIGVARLGGVYAVSFLVAAVNATLAELWLARAQGNAVRAGAALVAGLVVAALVYGAGAPSPGGAPVRVAVVQGNLDLGSQWHEDFYGRNLDTYLRLTRDALRDERAALVVWPESALTFFLEDERLYRLALGALFGPLGVELVTGGPRAVPSPSGPPAYYNAAFLVTPDGAVRARYDKEQLLPFAEYFPLPQLDVLRRRFGRVREFTPGAGGAPFPTAAGNAGVVICNEAMYGGPARERVAAGATLLVALANDSWIGDARFAEQALDMAIFRAVEQGRDLVRASTWGPTAVVDATGRIVARTPLATATALVATVQPRDERTPYGRAGDAFALACMGLTAICCVRRRV